MTAMRRSSPSGISIHPPLAGRDTSRSHRPTSTKIFQSTRPSRDGTLLAYLDENDPEVFQSTRPSRDGTKGTDKCPFHTLISIHPPLAGRDASSLSVSLHASNFNPPAPRGTGRMGVQAGPRALCISIHPPLAGRDKTRIKTNGRKLEFQSTRPSRDGTHPIRGLHDCGRSISIHPPLAGRDGSTTRARGAIWIFQSTRPSRDGTPLYRC